MALTQAQITASGADFQRVFSRMTAAECRALLRTGIGLPNTIGTPPSYLTAEGALTYIAWNEGNGTFTGSVPNQVYVATGLTYGTTHRAHLLYDLLSAYWTANPVTFLTATGASESRQVELVQALETLNLTPQITRIVMSSTTATAVTAIAAYPSITERDNIILPIHTYYNHGSVGQDELNVDLVAAYLATQPAGRRYIHADRQKTFQDGSVGCMLAIPVTSGDGDGRYRFYDLEATTANRSGLSMADYRTDIVASDSKLRVFAQDLLAAGEALYGADRATEILDGFITDIEFHKNFFDLQRGKATDANTMLSPIAAKSITAASGVDTGTNILTTTTSHTYTPGDAVKFSGTLPSGITPGIPYYVNVASGTTFSIHQRRADSLTGSNKVPLVSTGMGTITVQWITETADEVFADSYWPTFRDSTFQPSGLSQSNVWDHANFHVSTAFTWYSQNFPQLFDTFMDSYYLNSLNLAAGVLLEYFPDLKMCAYDAGVTSSLHGWDWPQNPWRHAFGVGMHFGGGVSVPLYGAPTITDDRFHWRQGDDAGGIENLSGTADQVKWGHFVYDYCANLSLCLASSKNRYPYVGFDTMSGYAAWGTAGLWQEVVLHAALPAKELNFQNESPSTSLQHKKVVDLVKERDEIALYEPGRVTGVYVDSLPPKFVFTKVWCGNRWIARYTPNPTLSPTWAQVGANVVITYGDATTTTISNATLRTYAGSIATLGFWVEQEASAFDTGGVTFPNKFLRTSSDSTQYRRT